MSGPRLALLFAALVAFSAPALAQTASDPDRARTLGHEGIDLYNKGSWSDAQQKFEEAESLAHSPVFLLYLARSARNAGDLAAARAAYEKASLEVLPKDAPPPWAAAVKDAKDELEALKKRIAETPVPSATASASVPVPTASASVPVPTTSASVPVPTAAVTGSSAAPVPTVSPSAEPGSLAPGLAVLGLGAVGIGVGIGTFVHAKSIADDILRGCDGTSCNAADLPRKQAATDFANGATGAFIAGGVALAVGLTLVILRPGGKAAPARTALRIAPGFASFRIDGSF